jgi:mannose-6-phosphate isomerase-like protein (cupin superfamily)
MSLGSRLIVLTLSCAIVGAAAPADPTVLTVLGSVTMRIAVTATQTNGTSATIVTDMPVGGGVPAHVHTREDETYVVTRGHFRFWVGTQTIDAQPGTVVFLPRNVPHQILNVGTEPGEAVVTITPAGLERMFVAMSQRQLMMPKDRAELVSLGTEYGITYVAPLAPQQ